jgi:hypothetical protein
MKVTFSTSIEEKLKLEFKIKAAQENKHINELLEELLCEYLYGKDNDAKLKFSEKR